MSTFFICWIDRMVLKVRGGGKFSKSHHVVTFRIQWTYCFVGSMGGKFATTTPHVNVLPFLNILLWRTEKWGVNWKVGKLRNDSSWELPSCVQDIVFAGEGGSFLTTRDAKLALMLNGRSVLKGTGGQVCSNDPTQRVNFMVSSWGNKFQNWLKISICFMCSTFILFCGEERDKKYTDLTLHLCS